MSDCYLCGCPVVPGEGSRRRIKIGASRSMFSADWRYYYADQLLCGDCASRFDWNRRVLLVFVLVVGFIAYYWLT